MNYRINSLSLETKKIMNRCKKSTDLQYQKDVSYLLMVIRQREFELNELAKRVE